MQAFRAGAMALALLVAAAAPARAACTLSRLAEFPVRIENRRAVVEVTLDGARRRMMVDSGAFFSSIEGDTARELHLKVDANTDEVMGVGGVAHMGATRVKSFSIGSTELGSAAFLVSEGLSDGLAGLLGHNVLRVGDVEYDFGAGALRLMRARGCVSANDLAYWTKPGTAAVLPIRLPSREEPHTIGIVYVNGAPVRALFDTGAPFSVLTPVAAARAGVRIGATGVEPAGEIGGIGAKRVPSWIARFDSFRIDTEEIKNARLRIAEVRVSDTDMLIGADFFLSHRIYVSDNLRRMWLTYQGGPVFDLSKAGEAVDPAKLTDPGGPTDAEGLSRRASGLMDRRQYALAIVDLTEAIRLAPKESRYLRERADAWSGLERYEEMARDDTAAAAVDPHDGAAFVGMASAHIHLKDEVAAASDLKAAARVVSPGDDLRLNMAQYALGIGAFAEAAQEAATFIAAHPEGGAKVVRALDARCEALGFGNRDLDTALADCDRGVRLDAKSASLLEDRALVHFRRGEANAARADIDRALKLSPGRPMATYLRGLMAARTGDKASGQADVAAVSAKRPDLAAEFKRAGLEP